MKFSRSAGAAALCAAAVVLSMPAAAHAGGTKDPRYAAPPASSAPTSACSDRAPYTGQWVGHGRSIDLRDNVPEPSHSAAVRRTVRRGRWAGKRRRPPCSPTAAS